MTTVPPPTAPLLQVAGGASTAPLVQILAPPPAVAALPAGTMLEAVVLPPPPQPPTADTDATTKALVALRTPQGDVQIPLPMLLPKGTEVELQVVRTTPQQVTARVVTIDHQPATQTLNQLRQAAEQQASAPVQQTPKLPPTPTTVQPGAAWTPRGPTVVTELGPVSGVVVKAPPPPVPEAPQVLTQQTPPPQTAQQVSTPVQTQPVSTPAAQPATLATALPAQTPLPPPAPVNVAQLLTQASTLPVAEDGTPIFAPVPMTSNAPIVGSTSINVPQFFTLIASGEVAVRVIGIQISNNVPVIAAPPSNATLSSAPVILPAATMPQTPTVPSPNAASVQTTMPVIPNAPYVTVPAPGIPTATPPAATPIAVPAQPAPAVGVAPTTVATTPIVAEAPVIEAPPKQPGLVLPGPQGLPPTPPTPPQAVQPQPPITTLSGVVVSNAGAVPVIRTEAGEIQINLRANLPVGTRVVLEVLAQLPPRGYNTVIPPLPPAALPLSGPAGANVGWPTLQESLQILERTNPQAAQQLAQVIPDGGPRTALAMMSFAQAMRTGDARQWPGDSTLRVLERAGPRGSHLASTLSDEVSALSARARDVGPEWRAMPLPWSVDGRIERIALVTRREGASDDEETKKKSGGGGGTRFLINLELSRLGEMQLDGMFRKETRGFDMMIRTRAALPDDMRNDLSGLFATSNAAMGLKGTLSFQVVKKIPDPTNSGPASLDKSGLWV